MFAALYLCLAISYLLRKQFHLASYARFGYKELLIYDIEIPSATLESVAGFARCIVT